MERKGKGGKGGGREVKGREEREGKGEGMRRGKGCVMAVRGMDTRLPP